MLLGDVGRPLEQAEQRNLGLSRLGGSPAWARRPPPPAGSKTERLDIAACGRCGRRRVFLGQLHASFEASHCRVLYLFVCPTPACGGDERGWRALRSVVPVGEVPTAGTQPVPSCTAMDVVPMGSAAGGGGDAAAAYVTDDPEMDRPSGAAAEEEGDAWIGELDALGCEADWPSFALTIYPEPPASPKSGAHELELLERYRRSELAAEDAAELEAAQTSEAQPSQAEAFEPEEEQEEGELRWLLKFRRRLGRSPSQVLRYAWDGQPLWISRPPEEAENPAWPPPCRRCGSHRAFEVQLLPTLLYQLGSRCPERLADAEIDWGTVCLYSCAADCATGAEPAEELILVQPAL